METEYKTIFEFAVPKVSSLYNLIILFIIIVIGFGFAFLTKRTNKKYSLQRQLKIFFGYMLGGIAALMLIVSLIRLPEILSYQRELKETIETENYLIAVGEIENFVDRAESGHIFESFTVNGVFFEYSDYIVINGFHQTSRNNGPIKRNGQEVRISYMKKDNENIIMKIELKQ